MPKRHHKKMRGGFWESWWNSTKKATNDAYNSVTGSPSSTTPTSTTPSSTTTTSSTSTTPTSTSTTTSYPSTDTSTDTSTSSSTVGGRRKRKTRGRRGGYTARTPLTGLAFHAAPVSNIKTAQPHNWVGGKTKRKHRHRHSKSCKHRKH